MILKKILYFWKSILVTSIVLFLSFISFSNLEGIPSFTFEDKVVHFLMYYGLTCILIFDYFRHKTFENRRSLILIVIVYPILLGGFVEIIQGLFLYTRSGEWLDWVSDNLGVAAGWYTMKFILKKGILFGLKAKL